MSAMLRRGLGLGLIAAATLTAEVALTRLLSAGLFHHFAFVVVSTAMFGTAAGGLAVVLSGSRTLERLDANAAWACLGFAVGLPALFALSQSIPLEPLALASAPLQWFWLGLVFVLLALPFALAGHVVASILDGHANRAPALYASDLAGASAGCFVALGILAFGPSGLYAAAALAVGAAVAFGAPAPAVAISGAAVLTGALFAPLPLHISDSKLAGGERFSDILSNPQRTLRTVWSPLGRVDVVNFGAGGRRVVIDAGVAAVRVPPLRQKTVASDVTLPYELHPDARVLVIGAGAGWEVIEALRHGAAHVDAVEINPAIAREAPKAIRIHSKVTWHVTDGRSFLHRAGEAYDAILLLHTISNAATAAGALRMAEDYLLTVEALEAMVARLADGGILLMTRPEAQIPPLVWNLRTAGVAETAIWSWAEPPERGGFYAAVMVKPSGWTDGEHDRIRDRLDRRRLLALADPKRPDAPYGPTAERLRTLSRTPPRVATDDRPYFHQHRPWSNFDARALVHQADRARLALEDQPFAEASVLVLLVETTVVAAVVLLLPLALDRRRRRMDTARLAVHFAGLGVGFMLIEVSLVQRLGLLLGSPTLAFAVVFAGLLAGTAAGSALSDRWRWPRHAPAAAMFVAIAAAFLLPSVVTAALSWGETVRAGLALSVVAATGVILGLPFPLALRAVGGSDARGAWGLAVNGVASVAGTSLALLVGAQLGLTACLVLAAVAYASSWAVPPA